LGFAENEGPNVDQVQKTINKYGIGIGSTRHEIGIELENSKSATHILHE
jgi:7-keto-8-aminopelargonate synthetase-like enzyme